MRMYKYNLSDVEWGEFKVGKLFYKIEKGKCSNELKQTKYSDTGISYLSATNRNNGVSNFVEKNSLSQSGNCIMFVNQGDGGAGYSIYKKEDFIATTSTSFGYARWINKYTGLFVSGILSQLKQKYSFGYGRTEKRLLNDKIMLPIDENYKPNWQFMEEYIKERENKQRKDLIEYYKSRLLDLTTSPEGLKEVEWGEFSLRDLFTFERGNQNNMSACESGEIPLISAKKIDNGVKAFISDNGKRLFEGHILTLNNDGDGGVGIAYYQANKMALDTHVTALIPIIPINRSSLLFISKTITIQRDKFSHGYSLNNNRMKAQKIVLPIDNTGNPNWTYMENVIKNIEQKQIKNVLKYLDEYIYNV